MRSRRSTHALLLALALASPIAQAGRPLVTEDADVLDAGACEAEGVVGRERVQGEPASRSWTAQLACGAGGDSQLALAHTRAKAAGQTASGWLLGGKTALRRRTDERTGLALAWGASAEKLPGNSLQHEATYLNLVATRSLFDGVTGHANLGWLRSESTKSNTTTWNLAVERAVGAGVDLTAELYGDDRRRDPVLGLGARWSASEQWQFNASWSTQSSAPRVRGWTLGFKFAF